MCGYCSSFVFRGSTFIATRTVIFTRQQAFQSCILYTGRVYRVFNCMCVLVKRLVVKVALKMTKIVRVLRRASVNHLLTGTGSAEEHFPSETNVASQFEHWGTTPPFNPRLTYA